MTKWAAFSLFRRSWTWADTLGLRSLSRLFPASLGFWGVGVWVFFPWGTKKKVYIAILFRVGGPPGIARLDTCVVVLLFDFLWGQNFG